LNKKAQDFDSIKRRCIIYQIDQKLFKEGKIFLIDREEQKKIIIELTKYPLAGDLFMIGKDDGDLVAHPQLTSQELETFYQVIQPLPKFEIWYKLLKLLL
jgi:hypothetical protein